MFGTKSIPFVGKHRHLMMRCKYQNQCIDAKRKANLLFRSESRRGMCAKLRTVAASSNRNNTPWSFCYCLFAPRIYGCYSKLTSRLWWIAHSTPHLLCSSHCSQWISSAKLGWSKRKLNETTNQQQLGQSTKLTSTIKHCVLSPEVAIICNMRKYQNIQIPLFKKYLSYNFFLRKASNLWNSLPLEIKSSASHSIFMNRLNSHYHK